ncbi:XRE family transcriptional regulator [Pseudooceanicola lipolyticus]|jgi:transcriptional regulator with XRE-family HTH domain|uniref:XRE family transcriptional regulator n=1 Tax=Pseudooceanicola lipolyticus TaxID=2029104 RepID=A0A2M8J4E1_9RHOB|nr:XRE family transcriptional regulator [Pseudooceanicola lipolyticus]
MRDLAVALGTDRKSRGYTLRQVESATGVSNAYVSQLETGKIKTPSPSTLHKLAVLYEASYERYMGLAGYPVPKGTDPELPQAASQLASRIGDVSPSEADALVDYLKFLRQRSAEGS